MHPRDARRYAGCVRVAVVGRVVAAAVLLAGCSGVGVGLTRLNRSSFTYGSSCTQKRWRQAGEFGCADPNEPVQTFQSKWLVGYLLSTTLGGGSGSLNDMESVGAIAGDLFTEMFMGRNGFGVGVRAGWMFTAGEGAGYTGWHFEPMAYVVPHPAVTFYGGAGRVLWGSVHSGTGTNEKAADAGAWRLLGGVRIPLVPFFGGTKWVLDASLGYVNSGVADGFEYSGTQYTFGGILAF